MATGASIKKNDPKVWLQELKSNRQTQVAMLGFIAVLTWLLWPEPPKKTKAKTIGNTSASPQGLNAQQLAGLRKLPDLAQLDKARQLPNEIKVVRDLFLFDGAPLPPDPLPPPPKPKPPTEEELAALEKARLAAILQAQKDSEMAQRPSTLRYLGFMESPSMGIVAGFLKGEIPEQHKPGDIVGKGWFLAKVFEKKAEFQNMKFGDLKFIIEAKDGAGPAIGPAPSNEF